MNGHVRFLCVFHRHNHSCLHFLFALGCPIQTMNESMLPSFKTCARVVEADPYALEFVDAAEGHDAKVPEYDDYSRSAWHGNYIWTDQARWQSLGALENAARFTLAMVPPCGRHGWRRDWQNLVEKPGPRGPCQSTRSELRTQQNHGDS